MVWISVLEHDLFSGSRTKVGPGLHCKVLFSSDGFGSFMVQLIIDVMSFIENPSNLTISD